MHALDVSNISPRGSLAFPSNTVYRIVRTFLPGQNCGTLRVRLKREIRSFATRAALVGTKRESNRILVYFLRGQMEHGVSTTIEQKWTQNTNTIGPQSAQLGRTGPIDTHKRLEKRCGWDVINRQTRTEECVDQSMDIFEQVVVNPSPLDSATRIKGLHSIRRTELVQGRYMSCANAQMRHRIRCGLTDGWTGIRGLWKQRRFDWNENGCWSQS